VAGGGVVSAAGSQPMKPHVIIPRTSAVSKERFMIKGALSR
jgi:hypothetical protein